MVLSSNKNATICMFIMFNTSTNCPSAKPMLRTLLAFLPNSHSPLLLQENSRASCQNLGMTFAAATSDGTKVWSIPVRLHAATFIGGSLCRSWAVQNLPAQQNLVDSLLFSAKHRFKPVVLVAFIIYIQLTSSNLLLSKTN